MPPQPLTHSSARLLEFESLRELLRGYASSPLGQGRIAHLAPSTDRPWIQTQHRLTTEIREFRRVGGSFDFSALLDITTLLDKSRIAGAALETTEIRDVILLVDRAAGKVRTISLRESCQNLRAVEPRAAQARGDAAAETGVLAPGVEVYQVAVQV